MKNKIAHIIIYTSLSFFLILGNAVAAAENKVLGKWQTIDDEKGDVRSVVEIYTEDNKLYGRIVKTFPREGESPDPICDKCQDHLKDNKVIGMVIIDGLTKEDDEWANGSILDPENGKYYDCAMWLDDEKLIVRGYIFVFFRTQTWVRYSG